MEGEDKKSLKVATNFVNLMDNPQKWSSHFLSEDAMLDWFGRSVKGRDSIISFISRDASRMHHTIEQIQRIPPIKHRLLKHFDQPVTPIKEPLPVECGQGDGQGMGTPENVVRPNVEELLKAPRKKRYRNVSKFKQWMFLEMKCNLEIGQVDEEYSKEKNIQRIVLGYSDQIHLIVYEAQSLCRKNLYFKDGR